MECLKFTPSKSILKARAIALVQCHRTLSTTGWVSADSNIRNDILENYKQVISQAKKYIYIENQYIRYESLANWIIDRCNQVKELVVIFVLPVAPEEVSAKGGADPITKHGLYMQHKILTLLRAALPKSRFGVYSMVKKSKSRKIPAHPTDSYGSHQIYVHSKLILIDDQFVSIGSGNANGRSFLVDSELALGIYSPPLAKRLRLKLWSELLGPRPNIVSWNSTEFVNEWNKIAETNKHISSRKGFIVPHQIGLFKGEHSYLIPDRYAQVMDLEQNKDNKYFGDPEEIV